MHFLTSENVHKCHSLYNNAGLLFLSLSLTVSQEKEQDLSVKQQDENRLNIHNGLKRGWSSVRVRLCSTSDCDFSMKVWLTKCLTSFFGNTGNCLVMRGSTRNCAHHIHNMYHIRKKKIWPILLWCSWFLGFLLLAFCCWSLFFGWWRGKLLRHLLCKLRVDAWLPATTLPNKAWK